MNWSPPDRQRGRSSATLYGDFGATAGAGGGQLATHGIIKHGATHVVVGGGVVAGVVGAGFLVSATVKISSLPFSSVTFNGM